MITAIALFLKGVPFKVWEYLAVVAVVAAYTGFIYHEGGKAPKAALASLEASIKNAQRLHQAEDERKAAESITAIQTKEKEGEANAKLISSAWATYSDGLRQSTAASRAGQRPQSVQRIDVKSCDEASGNEVVSAAIRGYQQELGSALADYRQSVRSEIDGFRLGAAHELEQADKITLRLDTLQAEVKALAEVNN